MRTAHELTLNERTAPSRTCCFYLNTLVDQLCKFEYYLQALPVLQLALYVSSEILSSQHRSVLLQFRLAFVCEQLNLPDASKKWLQLALPSATLSDTEKRRSRDEIERTLELTRGSVATMHGSGPTAAAAAAAAAATTTATAAATGRMSAARIVTAPPLELGVPASRHLWTQQAKWLITYAEPAARVVAGSAFALAYGVMHTPECLRLLAALLLRTATATKRWSCSWSHSSTRPNGKWQQSVADLATYLPAAARRMPSLRFAMPLQSLSKSRSARTQHWTRDDRLRPQLQLADLLEPAVRGATRQHTNKGDALLNGNLPRPRSHMCVCRSRSVDETRYRACGGIARPVRD